MQILHISIRTYDILWYTWVFFAFSWCFRMVCSYVVGPNDLSTVRPALKAVGSTRKRSEVPGAVHTWQASGRRFLWQCLQGRNDFVNFGSEFLVIPNSVIILHQTLPSVECAECVDAFLHLKAHAKNASDAASSSWLILPVFLVAKIVELHSTARWGKGSSCCQGQRITDW